MKRTFCIALLLFAMAFAFAASPSNSFSALDAYDLDGNHVTSELFKDHDVTMVNVFTTWCYYCIMEMNDLRQLHADLPENANMVMICADAFESPDDLKLVVDTFRLKNTIIKMKESEVQTYYQLVGYPTTFFVDREGNILHVVAGARNYKGYMDILNSLLESLK